MGPSLLQNGPQLLQLVYTVFLRVVAMRLLSSAVNFPDVAMTRSYGVMLRLAMYLCLWKMVADILVAVVSFIHIFHAPQCSESVPRR